MGANMADGADFAGVTLPSLVLNQNQGSVIS